MTKQQYVKKEASGDKGNIKLFRDTPVWKSLLIMAIPSMVIMFVMGSYFFFDSVLSIKFASDSYTSDFITSSDKVRLFMNGYAPINSLMIAASLLFGLGISTRVAINIGAGRRERAQGTIKTGMMISLGLSIVMTPILILVSKSWIKSQYDPSISQMVSDNAFDYAWPVILGFPLLMFNNIIPPLMRTEARNKETIIAMTLPIFINLILDYLFMGPGGMGVEGGAWATLISTATTTLLLVVFIVKKQATSIIKFSNMFGFKFRWLSIIGIMLVGTAPFLRNIAQSITGTVQMHEIASISNKVYSDIYSDPSMAKQYYVVWGANTLKDVLSQSNNIVAQHHVNLTDSNFMNEFNKYASADLQAAVATIFKPSGNISSDSFAQILSGGDLSHQLTSLFTQGDPLGHDIVGVPGHPGTLSMFIGNINSPNTNSIVVRSQAIAQRTVGANFMTLIITGVMPVFMLFFPIMFAFAQASRPIAAYNYGAKNYKRVKQVYWWTILYATIAAVLIYFLTTWLLGGPLMNLLDVDGLAYEKAKTAIKIIMTSMIVFSFAIGAMVIFGSTDRILLSTISSAMAGLILFWPALYIMSSVAQNNPGYEFWFWWYFPVLNVSTSLVNTILVIYTLRTLDKKKQVTLDERVQQVYSWIDNKRGKRA